MKIVQIYQRYTRMSTYGRNYRSCFWNLFDLAMIIGYRRGLIKSMLNLASWILTFAIAYKGAAYFKEIVIQNVPEIQGTIVTDRIAYMIAYMG